MNVTKIDALPKLTKLIKVAAYARVSSGKDAMLHSLSAQVSHYSEYIQSNPEWVYAGVYADEAKTGTKDNRPEFQRMLQDCRESKIDLIITKSISRFARNTVTTLSTLRELKSYNVDVFFEEQNMHSISSEGEMILTIMASVSQEESRSVSENMKWRVKRDFLNGTYWGGRECLGYNIINKKLVIDSKQAELVKRIFNLRLTGYGTYRIANILNKKGIKTQSGKEWTHSKILLILENRNYTGDLYLQKTYVADHLTKKKRLNYGEKQMYVVEDDHEAIIDKVTFDKVQRIIKDNCHTKYKCSRYDLNGKIKCGICGSNYHHKTTKYKQFWLCTEYDYKGKEYCASKRVPQSVLDNLLKEYKLDDINFIEVFNDNKLLIHFYKKEDVEYFWTPESRRWSDEMKEHNKDKLNKRSKENG